MIKWAALVPLMLLVTILTYPLALVLPLFAKNRVGKLDNGTKEGTGWYLPNWLSWFQTPDNDLDGDKGWKEEHCQLDVEEGEVCNWCNETNLSECNACTSDNIT